MTTLIDAIDGIRRNTAFSLAAAVIIFISSFVFGSFLLALLNMNAFASKIGDQVCIEAYLRNGTTDEKGEFLARAAATIEGVEDAKYIASAEAAARLASTDETAGMLLDMELMGFVPASLEIKVAEAKDVPVVAEALNNYMDVENVRHGDEITAETMRIISTTRKMCVALLALMGASSVVVIGAVSAMTVLSERENIRTLKLIGATNLFVAKPFLMEGALLGGASAFVAALALRFLYGTIVDSSTLGFSVLALVPVYPLMYIAGGSIVLAGALFGVGGSGLAVWFWARKEVA